MKPSDLKAPFAWNARRVLIHDRILYVPTRCDTYEDFSFPGLKDPALFGNENPIQIEYCSGNGAWIAAKAHANPDINWIAVEKKFTRVRKIWSKVNNLNLKNLISICGEAYNATWRYLPDASFANAYINFPDPWPKTRHAKNRLIHPGFVHEIWRVLGLGGSFTLVTDDPDYSTRMIKEMKQHPGFVATHPDPYFITELPNYGSSYFEQLWREKGKIIRFHQFHKVEFDKTQLKAEVLRYRKPPSAALANRL